MSIFDRLKNLGRAAGLPWMPPEERQRPLDPVVLPQDERPHDRLVEWWHFIGRLVVQGTEGEQGRPYSFIVSVLKGRVLGLDQIGGIVVLVDEEDKSRVVSSRAMAAGSATFDPNDGRHFFFQFGAGAARPGPPNGWRVAGGMGAYALDIDTQRQLSLRLTQRSPAVLLGDDGRERYAGDEELGYCVWPRLDVRGTINTGLAKHPVTGKAWMEHQWGDVRVGNYHWKFIALMHGENRYSFFQVGSGSPVPKENDIRHAQIKGYRLDASGEAVPLENVELTTTDGAFHRGYPLSTTVKFDDPAATKAGPATPRWFRIKPLFDDQFLDGAISPAFFPEFWEGACEVEAHDGAASWAMTELAGFRRSTR